MSLPVKIHGVLDYIVGTLLLGSLFFVDFKDQRLFFFLVLAAGILLILNILMAEINWYSFENHILIDLLIAIFLLTSTWLFKARENVLNLLVVISIFQAVTTFLTSKDAVAGIQQNNKKRKGKWKQSRIDV